MINALQLSLNSVNGTQRKIIIAPVLQKSEEGLKNTGTYKIYKDAFGDESSLFTEPLERDETRNDLPDNMNPDYLGKIVIDAQSNWTYSGDLLSPDEQKQAVTQILKP
jgi:hypothetical protein